eukprot:scaffold8267_cov29-Phaeocystis_antarctica.AAC.2
MPRVSSIHRLIALARRRNTGGPGRMYRSTDHVPHGIDTKTPLKLGKWTRATSAATTGAYEMSCS